MEYSKEMKSKRLILRKFTYDDASDMFNNYCNNDNVSRYVTWQTHKSIEDTKKYLANVVLPEYKLDNTYRWAIVLKETNAVIGCIDVVKLNLITKSAEIGYVLSEKYWGQGIMPEAGELVVSYLFSLGFIRVWAVHDIDNPKSGRVMQKLGMKKEGTLRKYALRSDGTLADCDIYSIINEKF